VEKCSRSYRAANERLWNALDGKGIDALIVPGWAGAAWPGRELRVDRPDFAGIEIGWESYQNDQAHRLHQRRGDLEYEDRVSPVEE
jgi:hypothetical protein